MRFAGTFDQQCELAGLPKPEAEYRFHPTRRWRFDFAWPATSLAVEVDGGAWVNGRHSRGAGVEKDCEKYAEAMCAGWRILRVTPKQVKTGEALAWISRLLGRQ